VKYDRVKRPHQYMTLFKYSRIVKEFERRIDLVIALDGKEKIVGLPKQFVSIFPADHEVMIPEWLCEKENLI
jgi:hypothetical protein